MEAMNSYACVTSIDTFTEKPDGAQHPTSIAKLRGARLVTASETEEGRRWAETKIKEVTGGSPISARFMRQDEFEFKPQFKLAITGNNKPGLRSVDPAIKRRMNLIPFNLRLATAEMNRDLKDALRQELPGILRWMVDGCLLYLEQGLVPPTIVTEATENYLDGEDALGLWLEQCCDVGESLVSSLSDLFGCWKRWASAREEYVGTTKRFCQTMEKRGFEPKSTGPWRGYNGVAVRMEDVSASQEPWWGR